MGILPNSKRREGGRIVSFNWREADEKRQGRGKGTRAHFVGKTFDDDGDDGSELLGSKMRMLGQEFLETDQRVCKSR